MNPRDIAGNTEKEEEEGLLGMLLECSAANKTKLDILQGQNQLCRVNTRPDDLHITHCSFLLLTAAGSTPDQMIST